MDLEEQQVRSAKTIWLNGKEVTATGVGECELSSTLMM